ncbi:DUF1576 domain-containing protein [Christensenellaceae bacterium OttesenSCG-928-M15]|nr:DUF1576 domain-containing protein [Christensenellaceae bacterium OttesenSCG-928-M15]
MALKDKETVETIHSAGGTEGTLEQAAGVKDEDNLEKNPLEAEPDATQEVLEQAADGEKEEKAKKAAAADDDSDIVRSSQMTEYLVFAGLAVILLIMGVALMPSFQEVLSGYKTIIMHPALIDFDAFSWAGNYATPFFNSGILLLAVLLTYKLTNTDLQGVQIAAMMMVVGFAFYGKNPLNVCFPVLGVMLHSVILKKKLSSVMALAWFSTALSPVFSVLAYGTETLVPGSALALIVGAVFAILAGMLISVFSSYLPMLHKGRILYNAGFAAGLAGMLINALQKAFSIGHDRYPYQDTNYVTGENKLFALLLLAIFAYFIITGIALGGRRRYKKLIWYRCFGGNFVQEHGFGACLINMGVVGLLATGYVFLTTTGQLNGTIYACILTAVGFAAAGVTVREYLPTMAGVFVMSFITGGVSGVIGGGEFIASAFAKVGSRSMLLAAIYSCGLAPVVGTFGWLAGMFVGAVHSILVPNTGALHSWMSLYNNGFSLSLIALFLFPIYSKIRVGKRTLGAGPVD